MSQQVSHRNIRNLEKKIIKITNDEKFVKVCLHFGKAVLHHVVKVKIPEGFEEIEKFKECQLTSVSYRPTSRILELPIVIRIQTTEKLQFITIS